MLYFHKKILKNGSAIELSFGMKGMSQKIFHRWTKIEVDILIELTELCNFSSGLPTRRPLPLALWALEVGGNGHFFDQTWIDHKSVSLLNFGNSLLHFVAGDWGFILCQDHFGSRHSHNFILGQISKNTPKIDVPLRSQSTLKRLAYTSKLSITIALYMGNVYAKNQKNWVALKSRAPIWTEGGQKLKIL